MMAAMFLLYGTNGYWCSDVPQGLIDKLGELNQLGEVFNSVALRDDGGYVLLYGINGFWCSGIPQSLIDKLWNP